MSDIVERLMRGGYISKAECMTHDEEIGRAMDAYPKAMAALREHERLMERCICDYDGDAHDDGTPYSYRIPKPGCPVHAEEDAE